VTVLNPSPGVRTRNICQIVVAITPGPRQSVDLELFFHPLANELSRLSAGTPGVRVSGCSEPCTLRAHVLQFTANMSVFDLLLSATG